AGERFLARGLGLGRRPPPAAPAAAPLAPRTAARVHRAGRAEAWQEPGPPRPAGARRRRSRGRARGPARPRRPPPRPRLGRAALDRARRPRQQRVLPAAAAGLTTRPSRTGGWVTARWS